MGAESTPGKSSEQPKAGEQRVFLCVVDQSEEMKVALRFACRRALHTGGRVALLYVTEPAEGEWLRSVSELMREERRNEAELRLQELASVATALSGQMPMLHVREGEAREELLKLLDEEPSISILVLGADTGPKGPGPLVTALTGRYCSKLRVPLTVVPGSLSEAAVDAIA
jgi:nucleotide-binding universal stress UspA family protein